MDPLSAGFHPETPKAAAPRRLFLLLRAVTVSPSRLSGAGRTPRPGHMTIARQRGVTALVQLAHKQVLYLATIYILCSVFRHLCSCDVCSSFATQTGEGAAKDSSLALNLRAEALPICPHSARIVLGTAIGESGPVSDSTAPNILDGLKPLHPRRTVVEVRILNTPRGTVSGYFDDLEKLGEAIAPWDGRASIYTTVNPILPDLLARAPNRLIHFARVTTKDSEIQRRYSFLLDIDPVRPRGLPATDAEVSVAISQRDEIELWCRAGAWPEPLTAMSGNGAHAMWRVDEHARQAPRRQPLREIRRVRLEYQRHQVRVVKLRNRTGEQFVGAVAAHSPCLQPPHHQPRNCD